MTEQVQGRPTAQRHSRNGVERVTRVAESRLEPQREQDDAGDDRQVEVAVRIAREPRLLDTAGLDQGMSLEAQATV